MRKVTVNGEEFLVAIEKKMNSICNKPKFNLRSKSLLILQIIVNICPPFFKVSVKDSIFC